ncbi:hypothetical protein LTR86_005515 [Recurvomyces mirabilis]|nr:hypothetical protein LTR86_005515 [Recurvomyces mirabilis]
MPPRKSNVSVATNGGDEGAEPTPAKATKEGFGVEDLSLPKSMIARLAKGVLPANTQIHKDALLALHKSATVFVSYIASTSNENAQASGKKTIMPPDVVAALKDAEFEEFLPRLEAELKKYNDTQCDKRNTYRKRVKEEKTVTVVPGEGEGEQAADSTTPLANGTANGHATEDDAERPAKKVKGDAGLALPPDPDSVEDEDVDEANGDIPDDADDQEDEPEDDDVDQDDDAEDDDGQDETMEDPADQLEDRGELQDEALDDEPDSD